MLRKQPVINELNQIIATDTKDFKPFIDSLESEKYSQALRRLLTLDKLSPEMQRKKLVILKHLFDYTDQHKIAMDFLERPVSSQTSPSPKSALEIARGKPEAAALMAYLLYRNRVRVFTQTEANMISELAKGLVPGFEPSGNGSRLKYTDEHHKAADIVEKQLENSLKQLLSQTATKTPDAAPVPEKLTTTVTPASSISSTSGLPPQAPSLPVSSTKQVKKELSFYQKTRHQIADNVTNGILPIAAGVMGYSGLISFANYAGSLCKSAFNKATNMLDEASDNSRFSPSSIKK